VSQALRTALIWNDEVMEDLVLDKPRAITIGNNGRTTLTVPDIGLPAKFTLVKPGKRGYLLTLGAGMRGTICIDGREQDVADLVRREGASNGGFCATSIGPRDWGVVDLDPSGQFKIYFQFVTLDEPPVFFTKPVLLAGSLGYVLSSIALTVLWLLKGQELDESIFRGVGMSTVAIALGGIAWSLMRQDGESQASLAFSVVLHAALLFMTYQLYDGDDPFTYPGSRSLTGAYLVTRLDKEEPPKPEPKTPTVSGTAGAAAEANKNPPKKTATKGDEGKSGGKGETERARDPNAKDVPPEPPKVAFFEDKNRKVLDNIIDRNLSTSLSKFTGIKGDTLTKGSMGFGPGTGTGVGPGEGTGTRSGSKGKGNGGGGNVEGDFVTGPGKIDTGGMRPGGGNCKGAGCGTGGPKAVQVAISDPSGDFGGLTMDEIGRVVRARAGVFRACYQKELNHTPGIGGKILIHFKIGGDGAVDAGATAIAGGSTMHNDAVESCIKSNVNRLKFPAKGGIANVNYPFVFTQGG
jgi:hypothetical protein